jgi:hypothetical protein
MTQKYAILSMGALGDTICHYFKRGGIFGQIESYKRKHPRGLVKVICCSSNNQTYKLFQNNPNICKVHHVPWALQSVGIKERNAEFQRLLKGWKCLNIGDKLPKAKFSPPKIFLNKKEELFVQSIQNNGKYILIHPFSSYIHKVREKEYINVIDTMIDDLGYNVVVVGGSYKKSFQQCEPPHKEVFEYKRDKLYNLVNQIDIRVAIRLAKGAYGYFGTWSAFYCACWDCPSHPMVLCTKDKVQTIDLVNKRKFGKTRYKKIITPGSWHIIPSLSSANRIKLALRLEGNRQKIKQEVINHLGKNI